MHETFTSGVLKALFEMESEFQALLKKYSEKLNIEDMEI